ncbi:MAG: succinate dehydrogenase cytochrome b subunit [Bacteroidales bacterium]|nr:succinate dehydrogenase cytochrome b subunit [Bacteroidales bacterium]
MDTTKLIKISSITKKLLVALFASFLLIFLLFHMTANLFILAKDGGDAYSAFCHFMGTNIFVKVFEVVLFGCLVLHLCLASYLWFQNRRNRPVGYKKPSRTKTGKGSKLMMITGSLLLVCLIFHFYDFYFVKLNFVEGTYMVKTEEFMVNDPNQEVSEEAQMVFMNLLNDGKASKDMQWIRQISTEERDVLQQAFPEAEFEPDFYHMARQKFSVWHIVLCYLLFFAIVGIHIRHGFQSAFQTFGLNHYKYSRLIEILGVVYTWVVILGFAIVPLGVFFGL